MTVAWTGERTGEECKLFVSTNHSPFKPLCLPVTLHTHGQTHFSAAQLSWLSITVSHFEISKRRRCQFWKQGGSFSRVQGTQTDKKWECFDRLLRSWSADLTWGQTVKKEERGRKKGVIQAVAVCNVCVCVRFVCVCVSSAVRGVNLRVDRSGKTLETAWRVVLLFWASA